MFNQHSFKAVDASTFDEGRFTRPLYGSYCFSNITQSIEALLTKGDFTHLPNDVFGKNLKRYKNIVIFLVDGFGWQMFEKARKRSLPLEHIINRGIVSKLTAQFPSTTSAAMTSLHTGKTVGAHGIYEWFYYEPKVGAVIAPLLFSFAEDKIRNTLQRKGVRPEEIFPQTTFYESLKKSGIESSVFIPQEYFPSPYSDVLMQGAEVSPYKTAEEGLAKLLVLLSKTKKPSYNLFYLDKIDSLSHKYGSKSIDCESEIDALFSNLENNFFSKQNKSDDTLILITTDHGQIDVDPTKTFYLNEKISVLETKMQKTNTGKPIIPVGGCRDMFLHIKEEFLEEAYTLLSLRLKNIAHVFKVSELVKEGFFGNITSSHLLSEHCGNLMIAPYENNLVWWNKNKVFTVTHKSHHGGLSKEEMTIPFICFSI